MHCGQEYGLLTRCGFSLFPGQQRAMIAVKFFLAAENPRHPAKCLWGMSLLQPATEHKEEPVAQETAWSLAKEFSQCAFIICFISSFHHLRVKYVHFPAPSPEPPSPSSKLKSFISFWVIPFDGLSMTAPFSPTPRVPVQITSGQLNGFGHHTHVCVTHTNQELAKRTYSWLKVLRICEQELPLSLKLSAASLFISPERQSGGVL